MNYFLFFIFGCQPTSTDTADESIDPEEIEDVSSQPEEQDPLDDFQIDADHTIDSTDSMSWVYFNLATGAVVEPENPQDSTEWDLKFQRYEIGVNGGVSGTAGVVVLTHEGGYDLYDELDTVPEGEWITDMEDADGDDKPEYALQDWFDYDVSTHVLTPKDLVYFIQNSEQTYKFRIVDYYGPGGESGFLSFDSKLIEEE